MKKRLARSLRVSSIEPETSIRQNITACAIGSGWVTRLRKRRSNVSMNGIAAILRRRASSASRSFTTRGSSRSASSPPSASSSASSSRSRTAYGPWKAMRRASDSRIVRTIARLDGVPSVR